MKTTCLLTLVCSVISKIATAQCLHPMVISPGCAAQQVDWCTYINWNWLAQNQTDLHSWPYYYNSVNNQSPGNPTSHLMPFFSDDPILTGLAYDPSYYTSSLIIAGLDIDYKPEDGWELVKRSVGNTNYGTNIPYWVFYNKYSAKLRIFILETEQDNTGFTYKVMRLYFGDGSYNPNLLVASTSPVLPTDQMRLYNKNANVVAAQISPRSNAGSWYYADFTMSYDPCICLFKSANLQVSIRRVTVENVKINIDPLNPITHSGSTGDVSFTGQLTGFVEKIEGGIKSYTTLRGSANDLSSTLGDLSVDLRNKYTNEFNEFLDGVAPYFEMIPEVGAIASGFINLSNYLSNFFEEGSTNDNSPAPIMIINSLKAKGTITVDQQGEPIYFNVPGGSQTDPGIIVDYNSPLGTFALLKTPVIEARLGYNSTCGFTSDESEALNHNSDVGQVFTNYEDILLKVREPLQWVINPAVGFDLSKSRIEARLEIDLGLPWPSSQNTESHIGPTADYGTFDIINRVNTSDTATAKKDLTVAGKFLPISCFQNSMSRLRLSQRLDTLFRRIDSRDSMQNYEVNIRKFKVTHNPRMFVKIAARLVHPSGKVHTFVARYPVRYAFEGPTTCYGVFPNLPSKRLYVNTYIKPYYENAVRSLDGSLSGSFGIQEMAEDLTLTNIPVASTDTSYAAATSITINSNLATSNGAHIYIYAPEIIIGPEYTFNPDVTIMARNWTQECFSTPSNPVDQADVESFCTLSNGLYKVAGRNANRVGIDEQVNSIVDILDKLSIQISPNPAPLSSPLRLTLTGAGAEGAAFRLQSMLGEDVSLSVQGAAGSYQLVHKAGAPGVYILSISTGKDVEKRRIVLQ